MFRSFWIIGLRSLYRDKLFSLINIVGLTTGMTACILISFYVIDELYYDKFHNGYSNIYRVGFAYNLPDGEKSYWAVTPAPLAQALADEFPEIDRATRIDKVSDVKIKQGDRYFAEQNVLYADSNFFSFFSFDLVRGNPAEALTKPYAVVLTEEIAIKYFSSLDVLGKTIFIREDPVPYVVTGVVKRAPSNSHFHFNLIISLASDAESRSNNWLSQSFYTYVLFREGADVGAFEQKLPDIEKKYIGSRFEQVFGYSMDDLKTKKGSWGHFLQPISDIHFQSNLNQELEPNGNLTYLYILIITAIFIVIVASVNFINLSTVKSAKRAREVGIRKAFGVGKGNLAFQFIAESLLISAGSAVLSLLLASILVSSFNSLADKNLSIADILTPVYMAVFLVGVVLIGFLAGAYPAFYITSFNPVQALKGKLNFRTKGLNLRVALVVFQYVIAIGLLISTSFLYRQLQFLQHQDLGFDKNHVIAIRNTAHLGKNAEAFKMTLKGMQGITSVSEASDLPPSTFRNTLFRKGNAEEEFQFRWLKADQEYAEALRLKVVKGRFFSHEFPSDSSGAVINEEAARQLATVQLEDEIVFAGKTKYRIIGVVKNFQFESSHNKILPIVILPLSETGHVMAVKVSDGADPKTMLSLIRKEWQKLSDEPLNYTFVDESFGSLYKKEKNLASVIAVFTLLIIVIACLGLFSLASFVTGQRTKEVAVRKIVGASIPSLFVLLINDFVKLVLVAFIISIPISYLIVSRWLQNFAYRIEIGWGTFIVAGFIAFLITCITVSYLCLRVARVNPGHILKYE